MTYVLYVRKELLDAVMLGTWAVGSHIRSCRCMIRSWDGGLSTMYDIHACLCMPGQHRRAAQDDWLGHDDIPYHPGSI